MLLSVVAAADDAAAGGCGCGGISVSVAVSAGFLELVSVRASLYLLLRLLDDLLVR